jgi:hypothetical protein
VRRGPAASLRKPFEQHAGAGAALPRRRARAAIAAIPACVGLLAACQNAATPAPAQSPAPQTAPYAYPPGYYGQPGAYPQAAPTASPYPPQAAPQGYPGTPPAPQAQSAPSPYPVPSQPAPQPPQAPPLPSPFPPQAPPVSASRPILGPLLGGPAWQAETRAVLKELIANLSAQNQSRVAAIPLVFDPNPNEVNAFAGCDDNGAPYIAGTEGLLEAVDAIAQTKATDELYGTRTYEAYVAAVMPRMITKDGGSALLPVGIIPPQYWIDVRRISRGHEMFDEIVGFTFGHELSHHYLGHTGCANGQAGTIGPAIAQLGILATNILPAVNQPNETLADVNGCLNMLDTGRARATFAYRWTEQGGLTLLDFFARLERASGANPLLGFLRTHPNPSLRIPVVQTTAATWRLQHPG